MMLSDYALINEIIDMEDTIYALCPNHWISLDNFKIIVQKHQRETLEITINNIRADGSELDGIVEYFCLEYYRKVQAGEPLNELEKLLPKRTHEIAIVRHPTQDHWRLRKRLFKRIRDRA